MQVHNLAVIISLAPTTPQQSELHAKQEAAQQEDAKQVAGVHAGGGDVILSGPCTIPRGELQGHAGI